MVYFVHTPSYLVLLTKYSWNSCTLAPKPILADAEAAEQWPRKEADEATGSLGRIKIPGSHSGAGLRTTLVSRCWRRTVWTRAAVSPRSAPSRV